MKLLFRINTPSKPHRSLWVLCLSFCTASTRAEVWSHTDYNFSNSFFYAAQKQTALGYRAVSLSSTTNRSSAVWLRDYKPAELQLFIPYEGLESNIMALHARGYRPANVALHGQIPGELYLVGYVKDGKESSLFTRLTVSELVELASAAPGSRIAWLQSSGSGGDTRYAGVLARDGLSGKLEAGLEKAGLESKLSLYRAAGYRPVCVLGIAANPGVSYTANWVQDSRNWTNRFDLSLTEFNVFVASLPGERLRAEVITQYVGEDHRTLLFSVVAVEDLAPVWTITGTAVPGLEEFDNSMTNEMTRASCTRASFALTRNGRLVLSRQYTHHPENVAATQPTSLFRVASISKTITAVAVLGLVEAGKLQLDDKLGQFIDLSKFTDSRWTNITIRHLLQHRSGWNEDTAFNPLSYDVPISTALNVPLPITQQHIIAYMKSQRLQANPGSTFAYSNFGYMLLGRVIEKVTGQPYEAFVRKNVLAPLGIESARQARTIRGEQFPDEVEYEEGSATYPSVMSPGRPQVAQPYGSWNLENCDAAGSWVISAEDLARFGAIFTEKTNCALLVSNTIEVMWAPAPEELPLPATGSYWYYGCGWFVQGINQRPPLAMFHPGGMPGTRASLNVQSDGYGGALLFNTANVNPLIRTYIGIAIAAVSQWPTNDLSDTDADGLPDSYEIAQFGSLSPSNGTGDYDGDGLSDAAEWVAMSSPVDAAEGPRLSIRTDVGGTPFLEVASRGGRVYWVQAISALGQDWDTSTIVTRFNGDGFTRAIQLNPTEPKRLYRLGVSLRAKPLSPGP